MKLRCDLNLNGSARLVNIVQGPNEPESHLALKLSAYLLFWDYEPILDASVKIPVLADYEFLPDLLALEPDGGPKLWVECGSVTMHKLTKVTRRMPQARLVVLKETPREAKRLREELAAQFDRPEKVEILAWPEGGFKLWTTQVQEKSEVYGEAGGLSLNLVINEHVVSVEFGSY